MAKQTITTTEYTDDLDGSKADGTITFSFDGTDYEIDLSKRNAREFEKAISVYVGHARKVRGARRGARRSSNRGSHDFAAIRQWANENGIAVSNRGRIPRSVIEQYEAGR